jgi:hypothetical protein
LTGKELRVLTAHGTEYCDHSQSQQHPLCPAAEKIDQPRSQAKSPHKNGICERFHRAIQGEFSSVTFRKKFYTALDELQPDLDH